MVIAQYFNQGFRVLVGLAVSDALKTMYKLEPSQTQSILAFTHLPWALKIFYGLISDNFAICGSKRKSYILFGAFIQFLSMCVLV